MTSSLPHPLWAHSRAQPCHTALCDGVAPESLRISYGALARHSAHIAAWARAQGLAPAQRVAVFGPHDTAFVQLVHGLSWLGATVVPLPPPQAEPEAALHKRLERSGARTCIVLPQAAQVPLRELSGGPRFMALPPALVQDPATEAPLAPAAPWHLDQPLFVLETSGTSGVPTSVPLTAQQVLMQSLGSAARLGHHPDDMWLDVLPLHHVGGLMILMRALIFGASACVPGRYEAGHMATLLQEGTITLTSVVPTMLARLLPHLRLKPCHPRVRALLLGGAPTPQALYDEATRLNVPVALTWGMTEAASGVCVRPFAPQTPPAAYPATLANPNAASDAPGRPSSRNAGPPLAFTEVWADATGALHIAGPTVAGPLRTGDRGRVEADGSVTILGRRDRTIISGGENIAPEEVEAVLLSHPNVADAAVVGVPDREWGERPVAHLVARVAVADHELVAFCRARLASFQIPTRFVWHAELPRNAMGKLQRAALFSGAAEDFR